MKKIFVPVLLAVSVFGRADTWTDPETGYTWSYVAKGGVAEISNGGECAISPLPTGVLSVVSTVDGKMVTSLGSYAFAGCDQLTRVNVPNSVTNIGEAAFYGCGCLEEMSLPYVGSYRGATARASLFGYIFGGNAYTGSARVEQRYTTDMANSQIFRYYLPSNLTKVVITDATTLGCGAFSGCSNLTSVTVSESVTDIGPYAFYGCSNLMSAPLSSNLHEIGANAFTRCICLDHVLVPDSVTSIGSSAFEGCTGVRRVTIGEGVRSIGAGAFHGCSQLERIEIGSRVSSIGGGAFYACYSLLDVYISDLASWCNIYRGNAYSNPFYYASRLYLNGCLLEDVTIPDGVTIIAARAFSGCTSVRSVTLPDSVTLISDEAFKGCSNLAEVALPKGIRSIGASAFSGTLYDVATQVKLSELVTGASSVRSEVALTVTNVVVMYVLNSVEPEVAVPVTADTGFVAVIAEVKGGSIAVPSDWGTNYVGFAERFGSDFATALTKTTGKRDGASNAMCVWQDYVAGTDPTDESDVFRASITYVDGKPLISWTPELTGSAAELRKYTIYGKEKLTDADWSVVDGNESDYNFFKVTVEMK